MPQDSADNGNETVESTVQVLDDPSSHLNTLVPFSSLSRGRGGLVNDIVEGSGVYL